MNLTHNLIRANPETDIGKEVTILFDNGEIWSKEHGHAHHAGQIMPFSKYMGEMDGIDDDVYSAANDQILQMIENLGIEGVDDIEKYGKYAINYKDKILEIFPIAFAGLEFEKTRLFGSFIIFALGQEHALKALSDRSAGCELLISVARGRYESLKELPPDMDKALAPLVAALLQLRMDSITAGLWRVLERHLISYIYAVFLEDEYTDTAISVEDYLSIRFYTHGAQAFYETFWYAHSIELSDNLRDHPLFHKMCEYSFKYVAIINDIMSFHTEIDTGSNNIILIECRSHSLQKSIARAVERLNSIVLDWKRITSGLISSFPNNDHVVNLVTATERLNDIMGKYAHEVLKDLRYEGRVNIEFYLQEKKEQINPIQVNGNPVSNKVLNGTSVSNKVPNGTSKLCATESSEKDEVNKNNLKNGGKGTNGTIIIPNKTKKDKDNPPVKVEGKTWEFKLLFLKFDIFHVLHLLFFVNNSKRWNKGKYLSKGSKGSTETTRPKPR